jgi:hypothetical protein
MDEVAKGLEQILLGDGEADAPRERASLEVAEPTPDVRKSPARLQKAKRTTEPMEQLKDQSLAEAASRLLHDNEILQIDRLKDTDASTASLPANEATMEIHADLSDEVTAVSQELETMPPLKQSNPIVPSRRRRRPRKLALRIEHVVILAVAVAAILWALVILLR